MSVASLLALLPLLLSAALLLLALRFRTRRRALARTRKAVLEQRGAVHLKELAAAMLAYTGRREIAEVLLQQAMTALREALSLAPGHAGLTATLVDCQALQTSLRDGSAAVPEPVLDSEDTLNRARMQLMEASRLLLRAEKHHWIEPDTLRELNDSLQQTRRSIELRLHLRQAAQQAADSGADNSPPAPRATPSSGR